ncbi:MAG: hypothetical protein HYT28_00980 [Parcubacteria group bacterium]|nr:hypothetical protein [Parcubacteria group bacterium]
MITNQDIREQIIKELELGGLPSEAQDEIISKLAENLLKKIAIVMLDKLPEDKRGEFEALANAGDTGQVYAFLQAHIPDASALIQAELQGSIAEIKQINDRAKI